METAWDRVQRAVPAITISAQLRQVLDREYDGALCQDDVARPQDLARVVRRVREVARVLNTPITREGSPRRGARARAAGWQRRAVLESEAIAARANAEPDVQEFRARYVPGWPLSQADATTFLRKPEVPGVLPIIVCPPGLTGGPSVTVEHPRLAQLGQRLATTYGWRPPEAVWFLLSDVVPLRWPLIVDTDTDGDGNVRITVSAALYVPTSAITAAINQLRRRLKARATRQRISEQGK